MRPANNYDDFAVLGADAVKRYPPAAPVSRGVLALAAGAVGMLMVRKHPVLAALGFSATASNLHAAATKDRTWTEAFKRIGRHVVATASSLALPKYPAIGYVAGAVAADIFSDGLGGGIIDDFVEYEGVRDRIRHDDVIDAQVVEPSTALTKVSP